MLLFLYKLCGSKTLIYEITHVTNDDTYSFTENNVNILNYLSQYKLFLFELSSSGKFVTDSSRILEYNWDSKLIPSCASAFTKNELLACSYTSSDGFIHGRPTYHSVGNTPHGLLSAQFETNFWSMAYPITSSFRVYGIT